MTPNLLTKTTGLITCSALLLSVPQPSLAQHKPGPLAHTYSIVARDPVTGDMGIAVQSHVMGVGTVVPWAEAGVGAIATQSVVDPGYGTRGLDLMRRGVTAPAALKRLLTGDAGRDGRQVAMIDAKGRVAVHTGPKSVVAFGHHVGNQYSVQANLMTTDAVWPAMASAYEAAKGDLAERLLATLDAAQAAGGDVRGRQSAALIIVSAKNTARPWAGADRLFDVRVDDHREPLVELRRLVRLQRSFNRSYQGDALMTAKKLDEALLAYKEAMELAPEELELRFWYAATLASVGKEMDAVPIFTELFKQQPFWADILGRLPAAGLFPDDPALLKRIQALRPPH